MSAASVIRNLDPARYEIIPVGIDPQGQWRVCDFSLIEEQIRQPLPVFRSMAISESSPLITLQSSPSGQSQLISIEGKSTWTGTVDVVFPVMHGTFCEDGAIQGLLEMANVPYVGAGVLGSAIGMDKEVAKRLARDAGLPIVPFIALQSHVWARQQSALLEFEKLVQHELGFPVFVKPANAGSSFGVHKVKEAFQLPGAITDAFRYDSKVLIEKAVDAREIELSVLENPDFGGAPLVSVAGEIVPTHEFYSYEAKYLDENGADLLLPAPLEPMQMQEAKELAGAVFSALCTEGMARVDLFLDRVSKKFYLNEINTIPGFTSISMFPKLWAASGIPYSELLDRLINLAMQRHLRKRSWVRSRISEK